jgi:hypothetical protein
MYLIKNGEKVKISSIENYKNDSHTSKNNWLLYSLLIIVFIAMLAGIFLYVNKYNKSKLDSRSSFR